MITIDRDKLLYCPSGYGGGFFYIGCAQFEGKTVKEVLQEIQQYFKDQDLPWKEDSDYYVAVNGYTVIGRYYDSLGKYDPEKYDNQIVNKVKVEGGWWSNFDFRVYTV